LMYRWTNYLDIGCVPSDSLNWTRTSAFHRWPLPPTNALIPAMVPDLYARGTPNTNYTWQLEDWMTNSISTNTLAYYASGGTVATNGTRYLFTDHFATPQAYLTDAPYYEQTSSTSLHWNVSGAAAVYKWQFDYLSE
jgi:hypothetical protein